ncbi:unnamed protein product [Prunus brigantina]
MWVKCHPFLPLVFSPKLEEERIGKGASKKVDQHMAACEFAQATGNSLFDQGPGCFG